MRLVIIGGSGRIGTKLVNRLRREGHQVLVASLESGVNIITGEGLTPALAAADAVVDVANSPSFEAQAALEFFETAGHNLLAAEESTGVRHHIALSIVGMEHLLDVGYYRAKLAQERLIKASGIPHTILRSTQFFEFVGSVVDSAVEGNTVRVPPALFQPIASDDVAATLADLAIGPPLDSTTEVAGPDVRPLDEFVRQYLAARQEQRQVIVDPRATFFGARLEQRSLIPSGGFRAGSIHFAQWLSDSFPRRKSVEATAQEQRR